MDPLNGTNVCSIGANGDVVPMLVPMLVPTAIGANGCAPLAPMVIAIGDHWIHYNGTNGATR